MGLLLRLGALKSERSKVKGGVTKRIEDTVKALDQGQPRRR